MLRFLLTVFFTAIATFCWIVFNPADSARNFLDTAGLLETLQETYLADDDLELDETRVDPGPDPGPEETKLPAESNRAISPAQPPAPGAAPAPPLPPSSAAPLPTPRTESFTPRGLDYDGMIAGLKQDNEDLKHRIEVLQIKRTGSNIRSSEAQRMQERITANLARIKELEYAQQQSKAQ